MRSSIVAGLDIGSSKTAVVIAEVSGDAPHRAQVKVLGVGQARTGGIRREIVTDIEATTESVRKAVKEAELMAGVTVQRLYTGIAGEHIHAWPSTGVVAVGGRPAGDGEIRTGDVDRVQEVARAVVIPGDRELIHAIPQEYIVDAQDGIRDPVGMAGTRLEAEVFIVTGSASASQNVRKAVTRAGYTVAELVLEPLASSLAVLTEDEMEIGVALVELGGGTTDLCVFHERKIKHLTSLPWGGATVTNDIAKGLSLPYAEAGRAKERFGVARADFVRPDETFEIPGAAAGQTRHVARELLAHIIEQRMDEIFGLVAAELERAGFGGGELGGGVVLTGGGAALQGVVELAERTFASSVRIGVPGEGLGGLADSVRRPKFATAAGLAVYGSRRLITDTPESSALAGASVNGIVKRISDWFADFF
ncbi:cell division protein FtsA [Longimicrobium terrae]|uniref:Cell division protein FtsA n=1 Tax=Longimicrobium terrae TaxID=1639882 RepID=A0A841H4C3_9BACT|nr:cell division protein FtsA [Longimicrobium terrae]MBB4638560.1 cell division protein FtsA [Longimicrobium terrae]MBB6072802.1 cell division protein FtsA [Longimicrobium terrae]NNC30581.1 cell division protein FtsA [Longimicrobium terrae]